MKPTKRILLGQRLFWTEKKDGSNIGIQLKSVENSIMKRQFILINSRNNEEAASDLQALVKRTDEYPKVLQLLNDNPQFLVYVEACRKGLSVTRAETYERDMLVIFDIFDKAADKFLPYVLVHQQAFHYGIPVVKLWAETRHRSEKSLMAMADEALKYCKANSLEGMVIKAYKVPEQIRGYYKEYGCGLIQAKVKVDIPKPERIKKDRGNPEYPSMPDSEVYGAIAKVDADEGLTGDPAHDMPLVAAYVGKEAKKHLYSSPSKKLFTYWQEYLARKEEDNPTEFAVGLSMGLQSDKDKEKGE